MSFLFFFLSYCGASLKLMCKSCFPQRRYNSLPSFLSASFPPSVFPSLPAFLQTFRLALSLSSLHLSLPNYYYHLSFSPSSSPFLHAFLAPFLATVVPPSQSLYLFPSQSLQTIIPPFLNHSVPPVLPSLRSPSLPPSLPLSLLSLASGLFVKVTWSSSSRHHQ